MTTSLSVEWVPVDRIADAWPAAENALRRGLAYHPGVTLDDMRADVMSGVAQLWTIDARCWCVVKLLHYATRTVLLVYGMAGSEIQGWRRTLTGALDAYAIEVGADSIRCFAHHRLALVLGRAGWEHRAHVMERTPDG